MQTLTLFYILAYLHLFRFDTYNLSLEKNFFFNFLWLNFQIIKRLFVIYIIIKINKTKSRQYTQKIKILKSHRIGTRRLVIVFLQTLGFWPLMGAFLRSL